MTEHSTAASIHQSDWQALIKPYRMPNTRHSVWQLVNTVLPYGLLWYFMFRSLEYSYWLTLLLAIPTAGFMVRTFIIFHDCGHQSFFKSSTANRWVGIVTGILTFTPWQSWWHDHSVHHATAQDLDRRGTGDVYTMTIEEYRQASTMKKIGYRLMRNPLLLLVLAPPVMFALVQRIPLPSDGKRERFSVWVTDAVLAVLIGTLIYFVGWRAYLKVQLPILCLATSTGMWLFYVQHNFEGTYWARHKDWDYYQAAIKGSSFYKLPRILQWFTGNIGFHHIHHLSPRIPNYKLPVAYRENPEFQVTPLTLCKSLKSLRLRLWDEAAGKLVGWDGLKTAPRGKPA